VRALDLIAQTGQDGFHLPTAEGEWLVWLIFGGIVAALWVIVRGTHRRSEIVWNDDVVRSSSEGTASAPDSPTLFHLTPEKVFPGTGAPGKTGRLTGHGPDEPGAQRNNGASTRVIVDSSLISTWSDGPAVSLNGSPTVSPTTAAP
jgi:hypothetical protein